jgi:hypothetical protein
MAGFIPPFFSKFGKALEDLLSKKFDFKHSIGTKNNLESDVTVDTTVVYGSGAAGVGDVSGKVKVNYKNKDFGEFEGEFQTKAEEKKGKLQPTLVGELKATQLAKGLLVSLKGTDKPNGRVGFEYKQENFAGTLSADVEGTKEGTKTVLEVTAVGGADNFSVGGQASYDTAAAAFDDFGFGSEFTQTDYTVTLKTKKETKAGTLVGGWFLNVPTSRGKLRTQVGGQVEWELKGNGRTLTFGSEHDVDANTTVKAKINSKLEVAAALEHRLASPLLKLAFSAKWDATKKSSTPADFGVALTFGDY